MDVSYTWEEETKCVDPKVYQQMADDGLLVVLAFGTKIPKKWAKPDGTVFGGVKVEEWDGFHDMIVIDEIHRCGSLGVGQGLCGGLQIGQFLPLPITPRILYRSSGPEARLNLAEIVFRDPLDLS